MTMTYEQYIASSKWKKLRDQAVERDKICQTCGDDGTNHRLEVHHRKYPKEWDEDSLDHLITLCAECHDAITNVIRGRRYESREIEVSEYTSTQPIRGVSNGNQQYQISSDGSSPTAYAQRETRKSSRSDDQGVEKGDGKEKED